MCGVGPLGEPGYGFSGKKIQGGERSVSQQEPSGLAVCIKAPWGLGARGVTLLLKWLPGQTGCPVGSGTVTPDQVL